MRLCGLPDSWAKPAASNRVLALVTAWWIAAVSGLVLGKPNRGLRRLPWRLWGLCPGFGGIHPGFGGFRPGFRPGFVGFHPGFRPFLGWRFFHPVFFRNGIWINGWWAPALVAGAWWRGYDGCCRYSAGNYLGYSYVNVW
jgi:hypothetical protein